MDISTLASVLNSTANTNNINSNLYSKLSTEDISSLYSAYNDTLSSLSGTSETGKDFSSVLDSMVSALNETNDLQNQAEEAEIQFALGYSDNTHDLLIAQTKANVALQYTVAVDYADADLIYLRG